MVSSAPMTDEHTHEDVVTQVYELGYHLLPTVAKEEIESEVAKLRNAIEKRGGVFIAEGSPETITLATPMYVNNGGKNTKYTSAHFGWIKFELPTHEVVALKQNDLDANQNVLRYILVRTVKGETRAQVQLEENLKLREIKNDSVLEKREEKEEVADVPDDVIDKSIDDLLEK